MQWGDTVMKLAERRGEMADRLYRAMMELFGSRRPDRRGWLVPVNPVELHPLQRRRVQVQAHRPDPSGVLDVVDGVRLLMEDAPRAVLPPFGLQHLSAGSQPVLHLGQRALQHAGDAEALPVSVRRRPLARKPSREEHLPPGAAVEDRPGVALVAEAGPGRERLDVQGARPAGGERSELLRPHPGRGQAPEEHLERVQRHDNQPAWGAPAPEGSTGPRGTSSA